MVDDRLDFYLGGHPVGSFLGEGYPAGPGRYLYEPYRGEGHYLFAQALKSGSVECSFRRGRREIWLLITAEEFVGGKPGCQWFVHVAEVRDKPGGVRRPWGQRDLVPVFLVIGILFLIGSATQMKERVGGAWLLLGCGMLSIIAGLFWSARIHRRRAS